MKNIKHTFKIAIVDDSDFYNRILTKKVKHFTSNVDEGNIHTFQIQSFLHAEDFESNLSTNFDLVILDYFLGNGITGHEVLVRIKENSNQTKVAILSQIANIHTNLISIAKGANAFIEKDAQALNRVCYFIEDVLNNKNLK